MQILVKYKNLYKKLGYVFRNENLIKQALCHRSVRGSLNNERLEFLGDSVLNFIIATELFHRYPEIKEGALSRLRSNLVNGIVLSQLAIELQIEKYIEFGSEEIRFAISKNNSVLADAIEAVIGALYLDGGFNIVQYNVLHWFDKLLLQTTNVVQKDPKSTLQEFVQMHHLPLPIYTVVNTTGLAHEKKFTVSCRVYNIDEISLGSGLSKRNAESNAATTMLHMLDKIVIKKV